MARRPGPVTPTAVPAHPPEGWVRLGRLGRTFRVQGDLRVHTAGPAADAALLELARRDEPVWLSGVGPTRLRGARRVGAGVVAAFQGVYTPERASGLVLQEIWCPAAAVAATRADAAGRAAASGAVAGAAPAGAAAGDATEPPFELLVGAPVRLDGAPYGRVAEVVAAAQDLLRVDGPAGSRWVPWSAPYVRWDGEAVAIDDPPRGLLDDD